MLTYKETFVIHTVYKASCDKEFHSSTNYVFSTVTCMYTPMWCALEVRSCQRLLKITLLQKMNITNEIIWLGTQLFRNFNSVWNILLTWKMSYCTRSWFFSWILLLNKDEVLLPFDPGDCESTGQLLISWSTSTYFPISKKYVFYGRRAPCRPRWTIPWAVVWMSGKAHWCAEMSFWTAQMHLVALGSACYVKANLLNLTA